MSGVDELVAFVRAALDEDERVAREALHEDAVRPGEWMTEHHGMGTEPSTCHIAEDRSGHYWSVAHEVFIPNAEHIARWDPARVLAEVKAKRRILDLHTESDFPYDPDGAGLGDYSWTARCSGCYEDAPCLTVRLLVQPYDGREGWRAEWQVKGEHA